MISADAIAILACLDLSDEEWDALDAELTEIETSADMVRLEREMAQRPDCVHCAADQERAEAERQARADDLIVLLDRAEPAADEIQTRWIS